jgi:hypothetical protein
MNHIDCGGCFVRFVIVCWRRRDESDKKCGAELAIYTICYDGDGQVTYTNFFKIIRIVDDHMRY